MKQVCRMSPKNYKSTRNKREKNYGPVEKMVTIDKKQPLINQYFNADPNRIFVGLNSGDHSGPSKVLDNKH